ncbi:MAG: ribosomal-processing cysteine protease Prp [Clostridia bacterium]
MIYVDFLSTKDGSLEGFRIAGHSGYAEIGSDIVCAAVSSAVYMAINTITDIFAVSPLSLRVDDAEIFFRIEPKDIKRCDELLRGVKLHLLGLEEQYPENINVSYLEV